MESQPDGGEVLAEINTEGWLVEDGVVEVDGPLEDRSLSRTKAAELIKKGETDTSTVVEVSVAVWFTKEFAAKEDDVQGYINTCFEEANAAYVNSGIPMRLIHHGTKFYDGAEINDGGAMIAAFRQHKCT